MTKKPVVNKRKRMQALAERLQRELELSECVPIMTTREAQTYDEELPPHLVKLRLSIPQTAVTVQLARKPLFSGDYNEDYTFRLVTRVWLSHLKDVLQGMMASFDAKGAA